MATNPYFSQSVRSEQRLFEDIVIESLKMYGQDIYYLPRDILSEDRLLGEDIPSRFNSSYKIEMYIENVDGFDGEGDLFTKFGVEIRDQATFIVSRRRWESTVQRYDNEISIQRPAEGDVLYIPFSKKLFEITHVEHEQPFYQLQNLPTYKLRCELFEYGNENINTGNDEIDDIQADYAYTYSMVINTTKTTAAATSTINESGVLTGVTVSNPGAGYTKPPTVTLSPSNNAVVEATISSAGALTEVTITNAGLPFSSAPSVEISAPLPTSFKRGEDSIQVQADGNQLLSVIQNWNDSDNTLVVSQFYSDDGKYKTPEVGIIIRDRSTDYGGIVTSVTDNIGASTNEQNDYFDTLTDFLDFSESNPFGEP